MKRNSRNTIEMATGCDLAPPSRVGVCVSTVATTSIQSAMPIPPTMNRKRRPKRSTVQVALSVNKIPKVALRALISAIVEALLNTFL